VLKNSLVQQKSNHQLRSSTPNQQLQSFTNFSSVAKRESDQYWCKTHLQPQQRRVPMIPAKTPPKTGQRLLAATTAAQNQPVGNTAIFHNVFLG